MKTSVSALTMTSLLISARLVNTPHLQSSDAFGQGVKNLFEDLHKDIQLELPHAPSSNPMAKYDYRQGDTAKTVGQFAKMLSADFQVSFNQKAKDPEAFSKNPIVVYGEIHTQPKLPSLRTDKGVVLMESDDTNRCLPKFKLNENNRCVFIDKAKAKSEKTILTVVGQCIKAGQQVVELIKPGTMQKLHSEVTKSSGQATALLQKTIEFVDRSFDQAYQSAKGDAIKTQLLKTREEFFRSIGEFNAALVDGLPDRDKAMLGEAVKHLSAQKPDESAVVIVGDLHVPPLVEGLKSQFPDRAIVAARPRHNYY